MSSSSLSARRLCEPLREVDRRLWAWADWSRQFGGTVGWPSTSVAWRLARVHETGQSMSTGMTPAMQVPDEIAEVEAAVLKLPKELQQVVMVQYFSADPTEAKARRSHLRVSEYSRRLENARWSMKTLLEV